MKTRKRKEYISNMSKLKSKICIFGTGGFAKEVFCCALDMLAIKERFAKEFLYFVVNDEYFKEDKVMGIPVIPLSRFDPADADMVVAVGDPLDRRRIVDAMPMGTTYATIVHPSAVLSPWVNLGEGSIVPAGVIITCNVEIGKHAHLNLHATIGHDCVIGDFFTASPGVNVSGTCTVGDCVYLGTNSALKQGLSICDHVTIGMGGVVLRNISEQGVYVGSPVKQLGPSS